MKNALLTLSIFLLIIGCNKKVDSSLTNEDKIAGTTEKTWVTKRETTANGDNDKLTREEKDQKITFWKNGNVKMAGDNEAMSGQWSYSGSTLTLHFTGQDVTENFTVIELTEDRMQLTAGDGSVMLMKPE